MKSQFIKCTKFLFYAFLFFLLVSVLLSVLSGKTSLSISKYLNYPVISLTIVNLLSFAILFVLELISLYKDKGIKSFLRIMVEIIILFLLIFIAYRFIIHKNESYVMYIVEAIIIEMVSIGTDYWRRK